MSPEAGAKLAWGAAIFGLVGGIAAVINPPDPPPVSSQQPVSQTASAEQNEQSATTPEQQWVSYYGDYYVTCYVTNGVRWYSAINQTNYNDAQVNQTPSDEMWAQVCGAR